MRKHKLFKVLLVSLLCLTALYQVTFSMAAPPKSVIYSARYIIHGKLGDRKQQPELNNNGCIVRNKTLDESVAISTSIQTKGPHQASPGQTIRYDLYGIANNSIVALEEFYIHDRLPTDAVRVKKLVTGRFNEMMHYRITYRTNMRGYKVFASILLTTNSYEFSLDPNALGLSTGEYIKDIRFEFPKVSPGFRSVDNVVLICEVMPTVPNDYSIVNRADLGGRRANDWGSANTSWHTKVWTTEMISVK